jgi:hypothetical protein
VAVRPGEPALLHCLAQGSPRPTVRWFRWQRTAGRDNGNLITTADQDEAGAESAWLELQPTASSNAAVASIQHQSNSSQQPQQQQLYASNQTGLADAKYSLSNEGSFLLLGKLQAGSEQRAKFKCLANNSYGSHQLEVELRLDLWWPLQRSVELRPRLEFIQDALPDGLLAARSHRPAVAPVLPAQSPPPSNSNYANAGQQGPDLHRALALNCTIRMTSQQLVALEWLKNGRQLFSVSLASYAQLERAEAGADLSSSAFVLPYGQPNMSSVPGGLLRSAKLSSIFDDPSQELILAEQLGRIQHQSTLAGGSADQTQQTAADLMTFNAADEFAAPNDAQPAAAADNDEQLQVITVSSTLDKLSQMSEQRQHQLGSRSRIWHSLRLQQADQLLYQLNFNSVRRSDRGSYQCRAKSIQVATAVGPPNLGVAGASSRPVNIVHQTSQLLLKDTPPKFIETFAGALVDEQSRQQVSLKCVASGSPLPEISWLLSGFQVPESSRFRVGDYVTRDGLIVSFVNITSVQPEGK